MRKLLVIIMLGLGLCSLSLASSSVPSVPADEALQMLKDGNTRYSSGQSVHGNQGPDRRAEIAKGGQHPIATIIGCSDSHAPLEIVFDQGVGDIFVIRVAGNVAGPDELASIEYGVGHLGTSVVLVLGHTSCGAVTAAVQNAKTTGSIPQLLNQIRPAVAKAKSWNPGASGEDLLTKSIKANVWLTMENILRKSKEVREFVEDGKALLVGGVYDLTTGKVAWLGQHPEQGRILAAAHAAAHPKPKPKPAPKADVPEAAPENHADSNDEAAASAGHDATAEPAAKHSAKPSAKAPAKAAKAAKTADKAEKAEAKVEAKPGAKSEGHGELLDSLDSAAAARQAPAARPAPAAPAKSGHQ